MTKNYLVLFRHVVARKLKIKIVKLKKKPLIQYTIDVAKIKTLRNCCKHR